MCKVRREALTDQNNTGVSVDPPIDPLICNSYMQVSIYKLCLSGNMLLQIIDGVHPRRGSINMHPRSEGAAPKGGKAADSHRDAKLVSTRARTPPRRAHFTVQRENFGHLNVSTHARTHGHKAASFWGSRLSDSKNIKMFIKISPLKLINNDAFEEMRSFVTEVLIIGCYNSSSK